MESIRNIVLDFCRNSYQAITVKQYDKDSRTLRISCTNYGEEFLADKNTMKCNVKMFTPDNRAIDDKATINDDGTITVVFTESMLYAGGKGKLELLFLDTVNKKTLSTMILDVIIVSSVYPDDTVIASDEFNVLIDALFRVEDNIEKVDEAIDRVTELETNVSTAEAERVKAESIRNQNELDRINLESARVDNERLRVAAEDNRVLAENERIANETERVGNEEARKSAEQIRESNETTRTSQESARQSNEQIRIESENARKLAETERISNEEERVDAETKRISAESYRNDAETERREYEENRRLDESARQAAESLREANTASAIANADLATQRANTAAEACEQIVAGTGFISSTEKGTAGGVATLDSTGKLTVSQLPEDIGGGDIISSTKPESVNCFWMQEY